MYATLCAEVAKIIAEDMYTDGFERKLNKWLSRYWEYQESDPPPVLVDIEDIPNESE